MENKESQKKTRIGVVVSNAMQKTVAVQVERRVLEPKFKKYMSHRKKFLAHDEKQECQVGDVVRIQETRPLSKRKSWTVIAVLKKGYGKDIPLDEGLKS